ncbi:MAG: 16S rRNA (guanine(966)-N(2))-methyltransferase RsmD [Acholeplasmataceae bacterium]|nr:16S rRNA (guanine(966)-N(2))-methyltransferase RsmD [Acholeplasmataceae bacterium]
MRIIAGRNKSRLLETLPGLNTRPMLDAKKEAVFNVMGQFFDGGIVLDLFGGSGALSLEALSRGCSFSYIVEQSQDAFRIISRNVNSLGEESRVRLLNMDYQQALRIFQREGLKFDYVFLDPPFRMKILADIIDFLLSNKMINEGGFIVCQYLLENYQPQETEQLKIVKKYNFKRSELTIYRFGNY